MCKAPRDVFLTLPQANASLNEQPYRVWGELKLPAQGALSMHKKIGYRTLVTGLRVGLGLIGLIGVAQAQQYAPTAPTQATLYCSGIVTDKPVEKDTYLISGEDSSFKTSFYPGDRVFINQGAEHGVKVGDQFEVIRAVMDMTDITWFKYQSALRHA